MGWGGVWEESGAGARHPKTRQAFMALQRCPNSIAAPWQASAGRVGGRSRGVESSEPRNGWLIFALLLVGVGTFCLVVC